MGYDAKIVTVPKGENLLVKLPDSVYVDFNKESNIIFSYGKDYSWFLANLAIEYQYELFLPLSLKIIKSITNSIDSSFYGKEGEAKESFREVLLSLTEDVFDKDDLFLMANKNEIVIRHKNKISGDFEDTTIPTLEIGKGVLLMQYTDNFKVSEVDSVDELIFLCYSNDKLKDNSFCKRTIAVLEHIKGSLPTKDIYFYISF